MRPYLGRCNYCQEHVQAFISAQNVCCAILWMLFYLHKIRIHFFCHCFTFSCNWCPAKVSSAETIVSLTYRWSIWENYTITTYISLWEFIGHNHFR
jgi:hypothetical protein